MLTRYKNPENDSPCFVIHNVFSNEECKKIISEYKDQVQKATHDDGSGGLTDNDDSVRSSKVSWINNTSISHKLNDMMTIANHSAGWLYDITSHEHHQFTKYEPNDHYSWHYDGSGCHFSKRSFTFGVPNSLTETANPSCINTVRKISASVLLNDDYSGGEFDSIHLEDGIAVKKEIKPKTGDAIFFPSHIQHRVRPVRVGTRYSLVCWFAGPPFK
jgi:PKHD-type hydroxylase|tara:strand:+ start:613 stop:1260 length:648 start_codon:yes stop_codon:yes gene_type:complete